MSFRLWTIFYVFALIASAMATFGAGGIIVAACVAAFWTWIFFGNKRRPTVVALLAIVCILGMLIALLLPAVQTAREASRRNACLNNIKQIAIGLINYHDANKAFPPSHFAHGNGSSKVSWRVQILPYMDDITIYEQYNFNEPWDGPNNRKLLDEDLQSFRCPGHFDGDRSSPSETNYFVVVGPETVFPEDVGRPMRSITDGTSKTILAIETSGLGINWTEPRDLSVDEAVELLTKKLRSGHVQLVDGFFSKTYYEYSGRCVAFCDGHVEYIGQLKDPKVARALLTCAGGEPIPDDLSVQFDKPKATTFIKWGRVWGLCVFVALSLLPVTWLRRQQAEVAIDAKTE